MSDDFVSLPGRRVFVAALAASPVLLMAQTSRLHAATNVPPTPACEDDDHATPRQTEGPYFKSKSPQRQVLRDPGLAGIPLTLRGIVMSTACVPIAGAKLDFWQADDEGDYDHWKYRLRGHQFTDAAGRYSLETIQPGLYFGRTRHIHVKVQAPQSPVLTTQLYFPGEARNSKDRIFNARNLIEVSRIANGLSGRFDFVLTNL